MIGTPLIKSQHDIGVIGYFGEIINKNNMIYYNMTTTLSENEIENSVELKGYNFSCDDIICQDIPKPLPGSEEGYFRMAIIGKSGSGKTNLLRCLTERNGKHKIYCKRFTNVFYISPSVKSMENKPKLPEDHFYSSLRDLPTIFDRIQNEEDKTTIPKQ